MPIRPTPANVAFVRLLVEDVPRGVTNVAPFSLTWNTHTVPDGEYLIEADALGRNGELLAVTRRKVFVLNHEPPHAGDCGGSSQRLFVGWMSPIHRKRSFLLSTLQREKSDALFNRAERLIPGGVNSPVRAFKSVGGHPLFIPRSW